MFDSGGKPPRMTPLGQLCFGLGCIGVTLGSIGIFSFNTSAIILGAGVLALIISLASSTPDWSG